jgi:hypothetical protein
MIPSTFFAFVMHSRERSSRWNVAASLVALLCTCVFPSPQARAEDKVVPEARIESARGMAMGTGARSSSASTQAQAENPANLVIGGVYHLEALTTYSPTFKRMTYGASVVDSMTSRLAAGISARGFFGDNKAGDNSGWEGRLGLGLPIGDIISLGVAGRYANFTVSDPHAKPEREPLPTDTKPDRTFKMHKLFTMDAAVTLRLGDAFTLSALGYNLIDTDTPLAPLMVGGSAGFTAGSGVTLGGDVLVDLNTHKAFEGGAKLQVGGGIEFLAQNVAPLRLGYFYDQGRGRNGITAGLGYVTTNFGVQLSLRQVVTGEKETTLMSAVQYFVAQ